MINTDLRTVEFPFNIGEHEDKKSFSRVTECPSNVRNTYSVSLPLPLGLERLRSLYTKLSYFID